MLASFHLRDQKHIVGKTKFRTHLLKSINVNVPLQEQHVAMNPNPSFSFGELPSFADSNPLPGETSAPGPGPDNPRYVPGETGAEG